MTPDMQKWLIDNREAYEFTLLHMMMHDKLARMEFLSTPVTPQDFIREDYATVVGALTIMHKLLSYMGKDIPVPPSTEFMRSYIETAAKTEGSDDDMIAETMRLVELLQDPKHTELHYYVKPYFEAWYGSVRAKKAARALQMESIPDVALRVSEIQKALHAAHTTSQSAEEDLMDRFLTGQESERKARRSSGIAGLDDCLNGGWGDGECYLAFGGTGAGKSIAAGQCSWTECSANDGYPLVITTELLPREYVVRVVACAAGIPINYIQDCENLVQLRQAVAGNPSLSYRLKKMDEVIETYTKRCRIQKVSPEDGMDAKSMIERECLKFEEKMGRPPTWVCLDWLGSVADISGTGSSSSERAMAWEMSANSCVRFAEESGIPTLILAQGVNDAQLKSVLTINDIGIAKGIGKNMVLVVGITNTLDKAGISSAVKGQSEMPRSMIKEDQLFCVCKARKGEGRNIPVKREFRFQRFTSRHND